MTQLCDLEQPEVGLVHGGNDGTFVTGLTGGKVGCLARSRWYINVSSYYCKEHCGQ